MEKILIAVDGKSPAQSVLTFGCYLARLTRSSVTGIVLGDLQSEAKPVVRKMYDGTYLQKEIDESSDSYQRKLTFIRQASAEFTRYYDNHGIHCVVHTDTGKPARDVIQETRFADLLLVDADTSFKKNKESIPTSFVKDVLALAECPVVIAPGRFDGIEKIVVAYDGSPSSMFALKHFTYLFPSLRTRQLTIVHVDETGNHPLEHKKRLQEWLSHHYEHFDFEDLTGQAQTGLFQYLLKQKKVFIVFGAYGKHLLPGIFRHSTADLIIQTITQAIFIAHN